MDSVRDGASELTNTNKLVRFYDGCTGPQDRLHLHGDVLPFRLRRARGHGVHSRHHARGEHRQPQRGRLRPAGLRLCQLPAYARSLPARTLPEVAVELGTVESVTPVYDGGGAVLAPREGRRGPVLEPRTCPRARARARARRGAVWARSRSRTAPAPWPRSRSSPARPPERLSAPGIFMKLLSHARLRGVILHFFVCFRCFFGFSPPLFLK